MVLMMFDDVYGCEDVASTRDSGAEGGHVDPTPVTMLLLLLLPLLLLIVYINTITLKNYGSITTTL